MDWSTSTAPLDKVERESPRANQALVDYAMQGGGRSLANLHQTYTEVGPKKAPSIHLSTLKQWSVRFEWQARVTRFDALQHQQDLERWGERAQRLREREWKLAEALMDKAEQMLKFPLAEVERTTKVEHTPDGQTIINHITQMNPSRWFFGDAARVIKEASRVARLATGQETENTKHSGEVAQVGMSLEEWQAQWKARTTQRRQQVAETLAQFEDEDA